METFAMGFKDIREKIGDIAFKAAMASCDWGGECGGRKMCANSPLSTPEKKEEVRDERILDNNSRRDVA